ncbi:MAG: hypothetical protein H6996_10175 [Moraxellaceae bacterium]|nr:hypothetical protein [Moraxellaceae bacterium]MCP5176014.1 hypothetical protein [Moraxellaceae bacterium]
MSAWELDSPIKVSLWQQGIVLCCYIVAVFAVWVAYIPLWLAGTLTVLLILLYVFEYQRHTRLKVIRLSTQQGDWFVYLANGQRLKVQISAIMWWRYLVVLQCHSQALQIPYRLILFPDSLQAGDYRKLQARLRLGNLGL